MLLIREIIDAVTLIVSAFCSIFFWLLLIRIILSWVGVTPYTHYHSLLAALYQVTDAILRPFQRLPLRIGMFDLSPMIAILVLQVLPRLVRALLLTIFGMG